VVSPCIHREMADESNIGARPIKKKKRIERGNLTGMTLNGTELPARPLLNRQATIYLSRIPMSDFQVARGALTKINLELVD
jgi:hypothetical protein